MIEAWQRVFREPRSEHLHDAEDAFIELIDLFARIIEGEGSAYSAADAETGHDRLCTMVPRAYGDAESVEQRAHIEVVDAVYKE